MLPLQPLEDAAAEVGVVAAGLPDEGLALVLRRGEGEGEDGHLQIDG
ncbi:MAG: hypothetical protein KIT09_20435 [Bryobacteraceae bacterium]|nr:hypothetical protein [Bryobacteraceae bacterium]